MVTNTETHSLGAADATEGWAKSFLRSLLDHWLEASATENGIFYPQLDRAWRKKEGRSATLVSQCRLIYNFSRGYETFQDMRYADAAQQGMTALTQYFKTSEGLYGWEVDTHGLQLDVSLDSYGHAFCLLALATAARAFDDGALAAQATALWRAVLVRFADSYGGLVWRKGGSDSRRSEERSQNPLMHMFEALMALCTVDPSGEAYDGASHLLEFLRGLEGFEQGHLIEVYHADWTPQPIERGGVINIGHQFEWALLLSDWHVLSGEKWPLVTGKAFLKTGSDWGICPEGGIYDACGPDGRLVSPHRGLWQQCEAVRALQRSARDAHAPQEIHNALQKTLSFYRQNFVDKEQGGLFAALAHDGVPADMHKGDVWKLDYHSVNMCLEMIAAESQT